MFRGSCGYVADNPIFFCARAVMEFYPICCGIIFHIKSTRFIKDELCPSIHSDRVITHFNSHSKLPLNPQSTCPFRSLVIMDSGLPLCSRVTLNIDSFFYCGVPYTAIAL